MSPFRQLHNYKDVQIAYLLNGLRGVQKLHGQEPLSKEVVKKAVKILRSLGKEPDDLAGWAQLEFKVKRKGRPAPKTGEVKSYKAQQIQGSGLFLRLPVDTLAAEKGAELEVRFERDRIEVRKKS